MGVIHEAAAVRRGSEAVVSSVSCGKTGTGECGYSGGEVAFELVEDQAGSYRAQGAALGHPLLLGKVAQLARVVAIVA